VARGTMASRCGWLVSWLNCEARRGRSAREGVGGSVWTRARGTACCYTRLPLELGRIGMDSHERWHRMLFTRVVPATATATQPYRKPSANPAENPVAEGTAEV